MTQLRSDRRTNFVGEENKLKIPLEEINKDKIKQELLKQNCDFLEFKMNVPHASHTIVATMAKMISPQEKLKVQLTPQTFFFKY